MKLIPEKYRDLVADDTRAFAFLATIMEDGTPQVTPVWFNTEEEYILINTARGRVKDRNMRQRPQVALVIMEPSNPYRYIQIRGKVVETREESAREHYRLLGKKYTGRDSVEPRSPDEIRVIFKIRPDRVVV
jgi:PPOX class probable F420-dependent enzyme